MKHQITYLHCGGNLKESLEDEIDEVLSVVNLIEWKEEFKFIKPNSKEILHLLNIDSPSPRLSFDLLLVLN